MVNELWKKHRKEYFRNHSIPTRTKFGFMLYWFLPRLANIYSKIKHRNRASLN